MWYSGRFPVSEDCQQQQRRFLADNKSLACRLNTFKYIMCVYNSCSPVVVFVNAVCDICSLSYRNI